MLGGHPDDAQVRRRLGLIVRARGAGEEVAPFERQPASRLS